MGCTCNWKITRSGARKHGFDSRPLRGAILAWLFTLPRLECPTRWMVLRHQRSNGCKTASLYWNAPSESAVVALRTASAGRAVPDPLQLAAPLPCACLAPGAANGIYANGEDAGDRLSARRPAAPAPHLTRDRLPAQKSRQIRCRSPSSGGRLAGQEETRSLAAVGQATAQRLASSLPG